MKRQFHFWLLLAFALASSAAGCGEDTPPGSGPDEDLGGDTNDSDAFGDAEFDIPEGCEDGDGDGHGEGCPAGRDCNDTNPNVNASADEVCGDRIDNNCDDQVDEDCPCMDGTIENCYSGSSTSEGVGRCTAGYQICEGDEWGECQSDIVPSDETCDRLDNDCDGLTDEGLTNVCGLCGAVPDETCNDGLDNNCDGRIDEPDAGCDCDDRTNQPCYGGAPQTLGVGACRGGTFDCIDGVWNTCSGQVLPTIEVCDGLDNDCDGLIDEGLSNACGDCGVPTPLEVCDGLDNDCDGIVDEGHDLACGLCSTVGLEEECGDGLDNNCDGIVDNGCSCALGDETCYPGPPDARNIGACSDGVRACDPSGEFWGPCTDYVLPQPEICDSVDNDCDGLVDISPLGCNLCERTPEECNAIDDDCDGQVDEYLRNSCGQCLADVTPEESCGPDCCDGLDNDCDGLVDEGLTNACGTCDDSCYLEIWSTTNGGFGDGESNGLSDDTSEGLRLGSQPFVYPYLWVANSDDGTVTQINTQERTVVDTYDTQGASPSRTAVDLDGNMWVANRAFSAQGSVTKIQAEECDGAECILFTRDVGESGDVPRGLAIDENNHAWVGTYEGRQLHEYDTDGNLLDTIDISQRVYGLAINSESVIYVANLEWPPDDDNLGKLGAYNIETRQELGPWVIPGCSNPYGIAVDGDGHVWLGTWSCSTLAEFDPETEEFTVHTAPGDNTLDHTRGVAVDDNGYVWVTASSSDRVGRYDPAEDDWITFDTCDSPIGIGVSGDGTIWAPCQGDDEVEYFDSNGTSLGTLEVGNGPYSYSDMTGFQLRTFTARQGTWTVIYDCGYDVCTFDEVTWAANLPPGTSVRVRARTSTNLTDWSARVGPYDVTPAQLDGLPDGRYIEIEITLQTDDRDITPLVTSIDVSWQRP